MRELLNKFPIKEFELNIKGLPKKIYFRGCLPDFKTATNLFAIVGTRKPTNYGQEQAFRFAKILSEAGLIIVSGMALGCDTMAHKGALANKSKTIAVLGTGLDERTIYPQSNLKLAQEILTANGCLISEYQPNQNGFASQFLQRNGLISGLSCGVLVVEAKLKSGALNTASWAKKQKKPIFALPGNINQTNSAGCNSLIQQGAKLAQSPRDILIFFKMSYDKANQNKNDNSQEGLILKILAKETLTIDEIIQKTKQKPEIVLRIISQLELEDRVKNLFGNSYTKC